MVWLSTAQNSSAYILNWKLDSNSARFLSLYVWVWVRACLYRLREVSTLEMNACVHFVSFTTLNYFRSLISHSDKDKNGECNEN